MRPLVTVEKRSFKKLILGLTHSNDESIIPNRKQILQHLKNSYNSYVSMLPIRFDFKIKIHLYNSRHMEWQ